MNKEIQLFVILAKAGISLLTQEDSRLRGNDGFSE